MVCFQGSRRALDWRIDGVCGAGTYPLPDLPREASIAKREYVSLDVADEIRDTAVEVLRGVRARVTDSA